MVTATEKINSEFRILDTSVPIHDFKCLRTYIGVHVVVPITLIWELDQFKKELNDRGHSARKFSLFLDKQRNGKLFDGGIRINKGKTILSVKTEREVHPELEKKILWDKNIPDLRILNIAFWVAKENPNSRVMLISKDVNFRMIARAVGIEAEDYTPDKLIKNSDFLYKGYTRVGDISSKIMLDMRDGVAPGQLGLTSEALIENQYLIFKREGKDTLAYFSGGIIRLVPTKSAFGLAARNIEQSAALHALLNPNLKVITLTGKAGTGKTLLALAVGLERSKDFSEIALTRPIVALSGKDRLGFLPGKLEAKINPFMQPLYDNLSFLEGIIQKDKSKSTELRVLKNEKRMTIQSLDHIRGRTFSNMYIIIDESQNITPEEAKAIATRAGEGTTLVFTGDILQVDHPYLDSESNGLTYLIEKMKGQNIFAHINLEKGERSELAELAAQVL